MLSFFRAFDKSGQPLEKVLALETKFLQGIDTCFVVNTQDPVGGYIAVTAENFVSKRLVLLTQYKIIVFLAQLVLRFYFFGDITVNCINKRDFVWS